MTDEQKPSWACPRYGNYDDDGGGHDWLDCPDCCREYEKWQENDARYREYALGPVETTQRNFEIINFKDHYNGESTLQQSSLAHYATPGTSAIWLGQGENRMHLTLRQVKALIGHLNRWVEDGTFCLLPEDLDEIERFNKELDEADEEEEEDDEDYEPSDPCEIAEGDCSECDEYEECNAPAKETYDHLIVRVVEFNGKVVIEAQHPEENENFAPCGEGKIGCILIDTEDRLGISEEAWEYICRLEVGRDSIGDISMFKSEKGYCFGWCGGLVRVIDEDSILSKDGVLEHLPIVKIPNVLSAKLQKEWEDAHKEEQSSETEGD